MKSSSEIKIASIYKLCSVLGKGSFGEVYQGINTKT